MSRKYLKILIIILIILFNPFVYSYLNAQTVLWAKSGSSPGFEDGNAIVTDDSGNVYVTGQFEYSTDFGTVTLNSSGGHDIFVAKYNAQGALIWARKAGGTDGDIGLGIGIDAAHNVYITGEIEDTVTFGSNLTIASLGGNDIYLAKYDAGGNILWAKGFGSQIGSDKGRALAVSPSGNCYFTGNLTDVTMFDNISLSSSGGNDIFITKINTNGNVVWAKKAGGSKQDRGYGIAIDANENVFVTGVFAQSATFKNTTITSVGTTDAFVAKYDSAGSFAWVRSAGACCDTTKANSITVDQAGNIYIAGSFNVATMFDSTSFASSGLGDVFLAKYDPSGNFLWARKAGSTDDDGAYGVAVDNMNQIVYITGQISGTAYFENQTVPIAGYRDIFVAAYKMSGDLKWVNTYGGSLRDIGYAITVDKSGNIYSTGIFNGVAPFGPFTLYGYPNQNWSDVYVDKIAPPPAQAPATNVLSLNIVPANCYDMTVSLTPGNGDGRIIVARKGAQVNVLPADGVLYSAHENFGSGSDLGNGSFIVYDGPGNQVTVTGLTQGFQYYFTAIEYNGFGTSRTYNTISCPALSASPSTYSINVTGLQSGICQGDSMTLIAGGAVSYNWSPSTGLSSTTTAMVHAGPAVTTTYTITGTTANGCHAETAIHVNVNPLPVITFSQLNAFCANSQPVVLNCAAPAGGTYSGNGITGGQFTPSNAAIGSNDFQYSYTSPNGCSAVGYSTIIVNAIPSVSISGIHSVCEGSAPVALTTGLPSGGVYSGSGVSGSVFNPVTSGNFNISYSYTDNNGCSSSAGTTITVFAKPTVSLGNDIMICADDILVLDPGNTYSSYLWSDGSTSPSIIADSSGTGLGVKQVFVEVTNNNGCANRDTINITFDLCAGINSYAQNSLINIYPNPFKKSVTINLKEKSSISVFDARGRMIERRENIAGEFMYGENFADGVYYIQISCSGQEKVYRIIKGN